MRCMEMQCTENQDAGTYLMRHNIIFNFIVTSFLHFFSKQDSTPKSRLFIFMKTVILIF